MDRATPGTPTPHGEADSEARSNQPDGATTPDRNEVVLSGRLSAPPELRILPSGDRLVTFRLIVRRSPEAAAFARPGGRYQTVDVVDCAIWRDHLIQRIGGAEAGDAVAVRGALRRRFSRSESGATSWFSVEVMDVDRADMGAVLAQVDD